MTGVEEVEGEEVEEEFEGAAVCTQDNARLQESQEEVQSGREIAVSAAVPPRNKQGKRLCHSRICGKVCMPFAGQNAKKENTGTTSVTAGPLGTKAGAALLNFFLSGLGAGGFAVWTTGGSTAPAPGTKAGAFFFNFRLDFLSLDIYNG